jgi:hypothetical protein
MWAQNKTFLALFNGAVNKCGEMEHTLLKDVTKITFKRVPHHILEVKNALGKCVDVTQYTTGNPVAYTF